MNDRSIAPYDVVVVGGGTAGCVLAARLSEERSRRVCLVEAGPDYGPFGSGRWPDDLLDARALAFSHSWETDREDRSQLRARVIGGCSAHNACVVLRGTAEDYDEWGPGWSAAELTPHLDRAERQLETRVFSEDELSPWHRAFRDAAGDDAIVHRVNARGAVRWHLGFAYLDEARGRENLTIVPDTIVDRVALDGTTATGIVTVDGEIPARTVVLAAGAYGSPGILLRSGIGPATGIPVGEGLLDHVGVGLGFEPTDELQAAAARFAADHDVFMAQVTVAARSRSCHAESFDLFLFPAIERGSEGTLRDHVRRVRDEADLARAGDSDLARPEGTALGGARIPVGRGRRRAGDRRRRATPRSRRERARLGVRDAGDETRCGGRRRRARALGSARLLPPDRDLRDRGGRRPARSCARLRWAARRGRVDHADHPAREHEPHDRRDRRAGGRGHRLMPETPEELHARSADALRMPPLETWETFPFDGALRPRSLSPPVPAEPARAGAGGVECGACRASDSDYAWVDDTWRLRSLDEPSGLPVVLILEPRAHFAEPGDLPIDLAGSLGILLSRVERAIRSIGEIGRVHICRFGDGSEHLHWWFLARPARLTQLVGSFAAIWDDVLPPTPVDVWQANIAAVVATLDREA